MPQIRKLLQAGRAEPGSSTLTWSAGTITVTFSNGRKQLVRYRLDEAHAHFTSTVLGSARARQFLPESLARLVLERNRRAELAGFRLGQDDRLEAWCSLPLATLSPQEACFAIRALAYEADTLEAELVKEDLN